MALSRSLLFYFIRDALRPYSENFEIVDRRNPVQLDLNDRRYSAHVSYIHDSGNTRPNEDEVRIQIGRKLIEDQRDRYGKGERVAFIGFF
jgi:hypothetical protein